MKLSWQSLLKVVFISICSSSVILFIAFTIINSEPHDFGVYYYSAKAAINGAMIYNNYGPYDLPYWYFPWLAWFFIPFAFFPFQIAYTAYVMMSLVCALITINYLTSRMIPTLGVAEKFFVFCIGLVICWLLFRVGQMDFLLLGIAVLTIYLIEKDKPQLAGLLVPLLLFKPHLFIIFLPYTLYKGGRRFFTGAAIVLLIILAISFAIIPDWPQQMLRMLSESGHRTDNNWNFTTFPNMLGMQENWSGTANLPLTFILIIVGFAGLWPFRTLPTLPFLSLALAGSLFCAPRAYSYNFPILIPAMIWVSSNLPKPLLLLLWLAAGVTAFLFRFSTGTYCIVLTIFIFGLMKARESRTNGEIRSETVEA